MVYEMCVQTGLQSVPTEAESWLSEDQRALKSWANSLSNDTYNIKLNWLKDNSTSPCGYYGVQCGEWGGEDRIVQIDFSKFNFTGSMPYGLGRLTGLQTLSLALNNFSGEIPADLGKLINLQVGLKWRKPDVISDLIFLILSFRS